MILKAEDGPHVVCLKGHRFYAEMSNVDHSITLKLVSDPLENAGCGVGQIFVGQRALA